MNNPYGNLSKKAEFFDSLKNAPNLTTLALTRQHTFKLTSLSEILKDLEGNELTLSSVKILNISGLNKTSPRKYFK